MFKIAEQVNFFTIDIKNWKVELTAGEQSLAVEKIQIHHYRHDYL